MALSQKTRARLPPWAWTYVGVLVTVFVVANAQWIYRYRVGQPYAIDEAGYLTFALNDLRGLISGGLAGWVRAIEAPIYVAPFATLVTSLVFVVTGAAPHFGFATTTLAGVALVVASFMIAQEIGGLKTATVSSLLVACNPTILNGVRDYSFAVPVAAVTALALLALLRSEQFRRIGWSLAFGVFLGLMPLTRTMTIAFVPGLALAGLIMSLTSEVKRRSLLLLFCAGVLALATMATWLVPNGTYFWAYLVEFGYGARSANYGPALGLGGTFLFTLQYICSYIYLPSLIFIIYGLGCLAGTALSNLASTDLGASALSLSRSKLIPPLILVAEGLAAMMTSRNKGSAFATPLIAPLIILSTYGLLGVARRGTHAILAFALTVAVAVLPAVTMLDLEYGLARPQAVWLPILGASKISDGSGPLQQYERDAGYTSPQTTMPVTKADGRSWLDAIRLSAEKIAEFDGGRTLTVLGLRGYLFNSNSLNMVWMFDGHNALPLAQVTPEVQGDTVASYERFLLQSDAASACQLLTATGTTGEIRPPINPRYMILAAQSAGFLPVDHWALPDGREVTLWRRSHGGAPCA